MNGTSQKHRRIETIAVHAGAEVDAATGAVAPPIHLSTTFEHTADSQALHGHMYIRESNPTQSRLEDALAQLEGGQHGMAFASGMGAGAAVLQTLPPGSHVLFPNDAYVDFRTLRLEFLPKWGIEATAVDMSNLDEVKAALRPNTRLVWTESPSNPLMKITDLRAVADLAHGAGARMLTDNTFATPILQRPLELGGDIVLHSTTKYCGGHSDVQGGALIFRERGEYSEAVLHTRKVMGAAASPFNSWLLLRGLRSLACRVERHAANAMAVAQALSGHPRVEAVHYPGLASDEGHEVASRQMSAFGGMLSFRVKGGWDEAVAVAGKVKLFTNATSLGGAESLIEHRSSSEGPQSITPKNLLRLSVGLEHADDLIADLLQALA